MTAHLVSAYHIPLERITRHRDIALPPGRKNDTSDNFDTAFNGVAATQEGTYGISVISHQCLESHGLVAEWDDKQENLTVWASTQAVPGTAGTLQQYFKLPAGRVKCITNYMGGGFGSKFGPDIQGTCCAELALKAKAPVKLMLDRASEITVGSILPRINLKSRLPSIACPISLQFPLKPVSRTKTPQGKLT